MRLAAALAVIAVAWAAALFIHQRRGGIARRASALELDVDDVVELILEHESGAVSFVHLDLLDRAYDRRSRWVGADGTLTWELGGPVTLVASGSEQILWEDGSFAIEETYRRELSDFLAACAEGRRPRADGRAGQAVLEVCAAVTVRS